MAKRPIVTDDQYGVLRVMAKADKGFHGKEPGRWSESCGWSWGTQGATIKILNALVKKGFVKRLDDSLQSFEITVPGRQLVEAMSRKP